MGRCRDPLHEQRVAQNALHAHTISSERFVNCPFFRCRFCCGIFCLHHCRSCNFHKVSTALAKDYLRSLLPVAPLDLCKNHMDVPPPACLACRSCGSLIKRVSPLLCSMCGFAWHPGCIPARHHLFSTPWLCIHCRTSLPSPPSCSSVVPSSPFPGRPSSVDPSPFPLRAPSPAPLPRFFISSSFCSSSFASLSSSSSVSSGFLPQAKISSCFPPSETVSSPSPPTILHSIAPSLCSSSSFSLPSSSLLLRLPPRPTWFAVFPRSTPYLPLLLF